MTALLWLKNFKHQPYCNVMPDSDHGKLEIADIDPLALCQCHQWTIALLYILQSQVPALMPCHKLYQVKDPPWQAGPPCQKSNTNIVIYCKLTITKYLLHIQTFYIFKLIIFNHPPWQAGPTCSKSNTNLVIYFKLTITSNLPCHLLQTYLVAIHDKVGIWLWLPCYLFSITHPGKPGLLVRSRSRRVLHETTSLGNKKVDQGISFRGIERCYCNNRLTLLCLSRDHEPWQGKILMK